MIQPTQDTDITSSISPLFHVRDGAQSEKFAATNSAKKLTKGRPPTSSIMDTIQSDDGDSEIIRTVKYQGSELVKSLGETFPWIIKFSKVIQSTVGSRNPKLLDRPLFLYIENMSRDINTCYTKPHRAAKVKNHINETLIFFHLYWKNIKEKVDDHNQYLDKMSEILAMYIDMELKASRRGKDSASKIVARLLTAIFIYLDNSEKHMFRILFRVKFITKHYSDICGPMFEKLFASISGGIKCTTDVTYVRYLLALKLWKKIKDNLQEKQEINKMALAILGQRTPPMNSELVRIIPKPPEYHKNGTLWLLQPNSFDLQKACDAFVKYELNERTISLPESIGRSKMINSIYTPSPKIGLDPVDRLHQKDILETEKSVVGQQQVKKIVKLRRFKPSFPKLRPGEVVFIDLTAENEEYKQGDGKKKKKKNKKKLKWLKEVSKKSKLKKEREIPHRTWIEKADAHSTDDIGEGIEKPSNNWPISEDKVTESTQRIKSTLQNIHSYKPDKRKCDNMCKGCKFCSSIGKIKYTANERTGQFESSENLVTSQTSLLNNNDTIFLMNDYGGHVSFGDFVGRVEQGSEDSAAHCSTIIPEPHSSGQSRNQTERITASRMLKQEPWDIIDDSTTNQNCDKIILDDASSLNMITKETERGNFKKRNVSLSLVKPKTGGMSVSRANIPSTSSIKNICKLSKVEKCVNESCVVSTTASNVEFYTDEQINVISGSTNGTSKSKTLGRDFNSFNNPDTCERETAANLQKSFASSKSYRSTDLSKNCYEDSSGDVSNNNKLQNSLIQALSLDKIIEIGKDDIDSQSDDEEDKEYCSKMMGRVSSKNSHENFTPQCEDNDFFQIPNIQLCDDLTNDNEVENLVTVGSSKSKVDEFENIDILDGILNGDMSMQDILEEQHLSMNSVNDTSTSMLGFSTEFFKQSEVTLPIEEDCAINETSYFDGISKSLPEGSLGMTGILNSLLDSDLTSIDSPPSDFMYSNVQTVDPRLIRKSPTAERQCIDFLSDFSTNSDISTPKEQSSDDNFTSTNSLSKKTKDQLFLDQKDSLNCSDLEEFGLNDSKETTFEMPVLEEELIQLPQHTLIDETIMTQISPSTMQSDIDNLNDVKSTDLNSIQLSESNYDYPKLSNYQEFTSLRLKDIIQQSANDIHQSEDLPTSTLSDFTPPQSVDPPQSPYTFTSCSSPAHTNSQIISLSPTHSTTRISRHSISANMLTPPSTPQQNQNHIENVNQQQLALASGNFQKSPINYLSMNSQSYTDDSFQQHDVISSMQKSKNYPIARRKPQTKIMYMGQNKNCTKLKIMPSKIEDNCTVIDMDQQRATRLAHVKVALTRLTKEEINARASGEQSLLKSHIVLNRGMDIPLNSGQCQLQKPELQHINLREFSIAARQNKSVLINLNGKTKPAFVFERNIQSDNNKSVIISNEGVNSRSTSSNILYKLTSNVVKPATSKAKPYSKIPKVNFSVQNEKDIISKPKSTITRCSGKVEISKETQTIVRSRCSTRDIKTQANKTAKEMSARKNLTASITEEPSMKKQKVTQKFLPLLENEGIIYAVNQHKSQEKHSTIIRREFARKDRTKKKIV